jgi:hypothetical protein
VNYQYDDPYNGAEDSFETDTPTLDIAIDLAIKKRLLELHTCLPAEITKVRSNAFIDAQPLLNRRFTDNTVIAMPVIQEVPVVHPRGDDYWLKLPIAVGDKGMLVFSERSLARWKQQGSRTDPQDTRTHDYSDAIFIPGLYSKANIVEGNADDMVFHNGDAEIFLQKAGKFLVNGETEELLDLISQTVQAISDTAAATKALADACAGLAGAVLGGSGFVAPINAAGTSANTAKGDADTIKTKVDDMTGSE